MKPKVLAVVGARLNSSRLPRKHLLDLAGEPVISRLFERLERVPELSAIVLATTADEYNQPLVDWARAHNKQVFAFEGDVNDLVGRVDAVVEQHQPAMVLYVCGDSPMIEPETLSRMVQQLAAQPHACMARLDSRDRPPIHEGFDLYRYSFWHQMVMASVQPHEREHVGSSMRDQWPTLPTAMVLDEPIFYKLKHRLSVDTPSDYRFMQEVYTRWYGQNPSDSIVSLPWLIQTLQEDAQLRNINAEVRQRTAVQKSWQLLLVLRQDARTGLGHLTRMLTLAQALQDRQSAGVTLLIEGPPLSRPDLMLLPHSFCENLASALAPLAHRFDTFVVDLPQQTINRELFAVLEDISKEKPLVSIDFSVPTPPARANWVPSFYIRPELAKQKQNLFGWERYLLARPKVQTSWTPGLELCVLTGGSDAFGLGQVWPDLLDQLLPEKVRIHWIRGPYAKEPGLPPNPKNEWILYHNPNPVSDVLEKCSIALTLYGISLFECLIRGLPTVCLSTGHQDPAEMDQLAARGVTRVARTAETAVSELVRLIDDPFNCADLSQRARATLDGQGAERLASWLKEHHRLL